MMKSNGKRKKRLDKRTTIDYHCSISEEGGDVGLMVESHNPVTAERLFRRLHKKFCTFDIKSEDLPGYR